MDCSTHTLTTRKTYPQNWKAYNAAQTGEKAQFLKLLHALCATVEEPVQTNGRPRIPLSDALFAVCYKIYSTVSARRFMTDLGEAQAKGYLSRLPHYNSLFNVLQNPELTPILQELIVQSSLPLASMEEDFAADSSGFTTSTYSRWTDHKYGQKQQHDWVKAHIMCGVRTNIVTAVEIDHKNASDSLLLPALLETTGKNFSMSEISADGAYASIKNYNVIEAAGATPYIVFNSAHNGGGKSRRSGQSSKLWGKMYHYFQFNRDEFMDHYHKRSNVETTFSMIKRKFGGYVRSKNETAMRNEVFAKIICHNICVLIQEMHEVGITADFAGRDVHPN